MKIENITFVVATLASIRILEAANWANPSILECIVAVTAVAMWGVFGYSKLRKRAQHGE